MLLAVQLPLNFPEISLLWVFGDFFFVIHVLFCGYILVKLPKKMYISFLNIFIVALLFLCYNFT